MAVPEWVVRTLPVLLDGAPVDTAATVAVAGGDINDAYRVRVGDDDVFVKVARPGAPAGMFTAEARGLRWLAAADAVGVPEVRGVADPPHDDQRMLVLDWLEPGPGAVPDDERDAELGRRLARLHRAGAAAHGDPEGGYIATLPLAASTHGQAADHFAERLVLPAARAARDSGALSAGDAAVVERALARCGELIPDEPPSRLHGDLWAGNRVVGPDGHWWVVDPAAMGGHREIDLAMMRLFGGFGETTFAAYREVHPLLHGHDERVGLWQMWPLLVHAALFGGGWGARAVAIARTLG